jgi:hypothetical protein
MDSAIWDKRYRVQGWAPSIEGRGSSGKAMFAQEVPLLIVHGIGKTGKPSDQGFLILKLAF